MCAPMKFEISAVADDRYHGTSYDFNGDTPIAGLTIEEAEGTITIHDEEIETLLRDCLAMERDRLLGFGDDELHRNPRDVVKQLTAVLAALDNDVDELVLPGDQERLPVDFDNITA